MTMKCRPSRKGGAHDMPKTRQWQKSLYVLNRNHFCAITDEICSFTILSCRTVIEHVICYEELTG